MKRENWGGERVRGEGERERGVEERGREKGNGSVGKVRRG